MSNVREINLTGASAEIQLGDNSYKMDPLSSRDIEELDNWLRVTVLRLARESSATATADERAEVMNLAFAYAAQLSWFSPAGSQIMATLEGVSRLLWQGLKKNHKELTPQKIQELLLHPKTVQAAMDAFDLINNCGKEPAGRTPQEGGQTPVEGEPVSVPVQDLRMDSATDIGNDAGTATVLPQQP